MRLRLFASPRWWLYQMRKQENEMNEEDPNKEINLIWRFNTTGLIVLAVCWLILLALAL